MGWTVCQPMPNLTASSPRAHRPAALLTLALAGLLAACNASPGATAPPTSQPTNPPGPSSTPGPASTPVPPPTPAPTPTPSFRDDQIEHPTGAHDIVLRMEEGGGFIQFGFLVTQAPQFTLYGDGTVIFQQVDRREGAFDQARLPWLVGHLDEDGIQALLQFALSTGRLANAKENYENPMIADAGNTIFTLNAAGVQKVVNIYALFEVPDPNVPDKADRAGFSQLSAALKNFENQDGLGDVVVYEPEVYRVILLEGFGEPAGAPLEWPWDDLTVDDFPAGDEPGGIAHLDAEHVAKLLEVPNGGHIGIWVEDPDGNLVQFGVRPLLPDEQAAVEASR